MVGLSRFELLTPRLSSVCSNQLSYRPSFLPGHALNNVPLKPAIQEGAAQPPVHQRLVKEPRPRIGPILSKLDRRASHQQTVVSTERRQAVPVDQERRQAAPVDPRNGVKPFP